MKSKKFIGIVRFFTVFLLAWLCCLSSAEAVDSDKGVSAENNSTPALPSVITLGVGVDGEGTVDSYVDLGIGFEHWQLNLSIGRNYASSDGTDIDTMSYFLGISSNPMNDIFVGGEYGYWGRDGELTIKTIGGVIGLNSYNWSVSLTPQLRAIRLYTVERLATRFPNRFPNRLSQINIDSPGYGIKTTYYGFNRWALSAGYFRNYYSEDLRRLADSPLVVYIFSPTTLQLASGFEKSRVTLDATYFVSRGTIGVELLRSRSAVDDSVSNVAAASVSWDVSRAWQLQIRAGAQCVSFDNTIITFGSLAVSYLW